MPISIITARAFIALAGFNVLGISLSPSASAALNYNVTDLGTLGGTTSSASAINAGGQVVGWAYTSGAAQHAFLYSGGSMQDLGTLGAADNTLAAGINANGEVVGGDYTSGGGSHAFLYSGGSMQDLGTLGGTGSSASGINASGQVVGQAYTSGGDSHAFLYSGGSMQDLGTLGGTGSSAFGINASGQVVGSAFTSGNSAYQAFLYSGGSMQDLGKLPGFFNSSAAGINASGEVVGDSSNLGDQASHAFLYSGGSMQDLGGLPGYISSYASGINTGGQVVGSAYAGDRFDSNRASRAFLYSGGSMQDLNSLVSPSSGWASLEGATAVNDAGQIVGYGTNASGQSHGFLLTPISSVTWNRFNGTWDTISSNQPWLNPSGIAICYTDSDTANFTDAGTGAVTINAGGVSPAATNVSNSSGTYTFTGGGILSGTLTKTNAGSLVLSNLNNAFTSVTVSGGTLEIAGNNLPANVNVTNNANLIIDDSVVVTASSITGTGNTTIGTAARVTVGQAGQLAFLNQASVTNNGRLSIGLTSSNLSSTITNGITGTGTTTIANTASVTVGSIVQSSLHVNGMLRIAPGAVENSTTSASGVTSADFRVSANATLDLGNSKFVIAYGSGTDPDASVASLIIQGRNGGAWNGTGITSVSVAANPGHLEILWADGSNNAISVAGATAGNELIEVTQLGDANGDGTVDGSDFVVLASHFGLDTTLGPPAGDFTYDGTVDGSDFVALAANFGLGTPFTIAQINAFNSLANQIGESKAWIASADSRFDVVPEPTGLALLAAGSLLMSRRRGKMTR